MKLATVTAVGLVSIAAISACSRPATEATKLAPAPSPGAAANLADYHNGLTDADRPVFYHLSEGSEMFPLSILQSLERKRMRAGWKTQCFFPSYLDQSVVRILLSAFNR